MSAFVLISAVRCGQSYFRNGSIASPIVIEVATLRPVLIDSGRTIPCFIASSFLLVIHPAIEEHEDERVQQPKPADDCPVNLGTKESL